MRRSIALFAVALAVTLAACQKKVVDIPVTHTAKRVNIIPAPMKVPEKFNAVVGDPSLFLQSAVLGSELAKDGTVARPASVFHKGESVSLTMRFTKSPGGLDAVARWYDAHEELVLDQLKPMNGGMVVTFTYPGADIKPGRYHVQGYWGGNLATDTHFEVQAK